MHTLLSKVNDYVLEKIALVEKWICTYHFTFTLLREIYAKSYAKIFQQFFNSYFNADYAESFSFSGG